MKTSSTGYIYAEFAFATVIMLAIVSMNIVLSKNTYFLIIIFICIVFDYGVFRYRGAYARKYSARNEFSPWNADFTLATAIFFIMIINSWALFSCDQVLLTGIIASGLWIKGYCLYRKGLSRLFGIQTEKKSVRNYINAYPFLNCIENYGLPSGCNVDLIILSFWGSRILYVVEIKSWHGVKVVNNKLVKCNGELLKYQPVAQVKNQVAQLKQGRPIIWLPNAKSNTHFSFDGVLIVNGDHYFLHKILKS